jgi:hypothetical protein
MWIAVGQRTTTRAIEECCEVVVVSRGQVETVPLWPTLVTGVALSIYVGAMVVRHLNGRVTSDTTLCAGGCGFWWPSSEVAGVFAGGVIVLVSLIGIFGRAFMFANSSGGDDAPD